jgi:hypothetical protein
MDLPSKAYTLRKEISILEHDLEIWELTRCAESRQAVLRAVAAIADALDRMVVDLAAHDPSPEAARAPIFSLTGGPSWTRG